MQAMRPDMEVVTLPGIGHAPILTEAAGAGRDPAFLARMRLARFIAAGFGTGYAPVAAGTVASAAAVLTGAGLLLVSPLLLALAALAGHVRRLSGGAGERTCEGDPGWVVIDEFAGQWITLLALARPTIPGLHRRLPVVPRVRHHQARSRRLGRPPAWRLRHHGRRRHRRDHRRPATDGDPVAAPRLDNVTASTDSSERRTSAAAPLGIRCAAGCRASDRLGCRARGRRWCGRPPCRR